MPAEDTTRYTDARAHALRLLRHQRFLSRVMEDQRELVRLRHAGAIGIHRAAVLDGQLVHPFALLDERDILRMPDLVIAARGQPRFGTQVHQVRESGRPEMTCQIAAGAQLHFIGIKL